MSADQISNCFHKKNNTYFGQSTDRHINSKRKNQIKSDENQVFCKKFEKQLEKI